MEHVIFILRATFLLGLYSQAIIFNATISQVNCSDQGIGAICHQRSAFEFDLPEPRYIKAVQP